METQIKDKLGISLLTAGIARCDGKGLGNPVQRNRIMLLMKTCTDIVFILEL